MTNTNTLAAPSGEQNLDHLEARSRDAIHFRFFKDICAAERLAVFKAFGVYPEGCTERLNHSIEHRLLDLILRRAAPVSAPTDWQAAHADMVKRNALLRQREDLPVDRIPAHAELVHLQEENASLRAALANQPAPTAAPEQVAGGADERALFEKAFKLDQFQKRPHAVIEGDYQESATQCAWNGWQERAKLSQPSEAAPLDADEMTRLRRLMKALGQDDAFERNDEHVRGSLCVVLGIAAGRIEGTLPGPAAAPAAGDELAAAVLRDVCELEYTEDFDHEKILSVTIDDLRLIVSRNAAALAHQPAQEQAASPVVRAQSEESAGWGRVDTVGDMVRNLLTLDQAGPIFAAFHTDLDGKRVCRTRPVSISRERVVDGKWVDPARTDVPYAHIVWAKQDEPVGAQQAHAGADEQTAAARDVLAERQRQVEQEGWTPAHDDHYNEAELSRAAAAYTLQGDHDFGAPAEWPWPKKWWKPRDERRNLVRAGALIIADIERLDRAAIRTAQEGEQP